MGQNLLNLSIGEEDDASGVLAIRPYVRIASGPS